MNYFIQAVANNLNAKCSYTLSLFKIVYLFFLGFKEVWSLKTGILFWGIYFGFIKRKLKLSLNCWKAGNKFSNSRTIKSE